MTEHGHQNLSLMNEKLKFPHIYTRCFLDGIIPIQNNSTPFSSILNYETLNHQTEGKGFIMLLLSQLHCMKLHQKHITKWHCINL